MKLTIALFASLTAISANFSSLSADESTPQSSPSLSAAAASHQLEDSYNTDVKPILDRFFEALGKYNIDDAYQKLVAGSQIASQTKGLDELKAKASEAIKAFGQITGYDVAGTKWIGTHLVRVTCISLGETHPLRWRFYFYKSSNGWKLIDIGMNARIGQIFEEEEDTTPATTN